eukprot:6172634-Pleurochrysis_carterae.AAC.1
MSCETILHAQRSSEVPVIARGTGQKPFKYPKCSQYQHHHKLQPVRVKYERRYRNGQDGREVLGPCIAQKGAARMCGDEVVDIEQHQHCP